MIGMEPSAVYREIQTLFGAGAVGGLTDRELLERFVARRGAAADSAFATLVQRHGPMVWGVCRRVLHDPHDAADAFQATFLILVRKASTVCVDDSLGRWLYGVSRRVAVRARAAAARRSAREVPGVEAVEAPVRDPALAEILAGIDDEIGRLPERYRAALILCDLGGLTHEAAARQLGCAVGTVGSLLTRGRERLRSRLVSRGLAPSAGMLAAALSVDASGAGLPAHLMQSTVRAAVQHAASRAVLAGTVPASVITLSEGVLKSMVVAKLKVAAFTMLAVCIVAGGAIAPALRTSAGQPAAPQSDGPVNPRGDGRAGESPTGPAEDVLEPLVDEDQIESLKAQLETKRGMLDKAKAQVELSLAIVATNQRLNARRPGMVSPDEIAKNEAEVKVAKANIRIAEAEIRETELRLRLAERQRDRTRGSRVSPNRGDAERSMNSVERRLEALEKKLDQVLKVLNSIKGGPTPKAET